MKWLNELVGCEVPITHGGVCGSYRERIRLRELRDDTSAMQREFYPSDVDDEDPYTAGNSFGYEPGKDAASDALNCELYWCWQRFEQEARDRKWSQTTRNRHVSAFSHHLRARLGRATADPGYVNARKQG